MPYLGLNTGPPVLYLTKFHLQFYDITSNSLATTVENRQQLGHQKMGYNLASNGHHNEKWQQFGHHNGKWATTWSRQWKMGNNLAIKMDKRHQFLLNDLSLFYTMPQKKHGTSDRDILTLCINDYVKSYLFLPHNKWTHARTSVPRIFIQISH